LPKRKRNALSRPTTEEIFSYRQEVTFDVMDSLATLDTESLKSAIAVLEIGIQHEQQHQELLLMDIKRNFFENPLLPAYQNLSIEISPVGLHQEWVHVPGGLCEIGVSFNRNEFAYDNEKDSHSRWVDGFMLSSHLVNNGEYLEFIEANGYENSLLWLSDGWDKKNIENWSHPLYWQKKDGEWWVYTLSGLIPLDPSTPVSHISFYEASAFAKWKGLRLPTEFEWEISAKMEQKNDGHFMDETSFSPKISGEDHENFSQIHGTLWEWTSSSYHPYPRYESLGDGLSEYNEKFMCNQYVLRGGSCVTPKSHYRVTYRNFYYPHNRWQFCGLRLAKDLA
jgi:ergothioneine biosynthesis protein EgtB